MDGAGPGWWQGGHRRLLVVGFGSLALLGITVPLPVVPAGPDTYAHLIWTYGAMRCIADGVPPLWLPDLNAGFGSPGLRLYSPLSAVSAGAVGALLGSAGAGMRAVMALAAAALMAVLVRRRGGDGLFAWGVILVSPATVYSLFGRGAMAEFCAIPLSDVAGRSCGPAEVRPATGRDRPRAPLVGARAFCRDDARASGGCGGSAPAKGRVEGAGRDDLDGSRLDGLALVAPCRGDRCDGTRRRVDHRHLRCCRQRSRFSASARPWRQHLAWVDRGRALGCRGCGEDLAQRAAAGCPRCRMHRPCVAAFALGVACAVTVAFSPVPVALPAAATCLIAPALRALRPGWRALAVVAVLGRSF